MGVSSPPPLATASALQQAIEREVAEYVGAHAHERDPGTGHRLVVRNGHLPPRKVLTGLGPLEVRQPRVNDRRVDADGNRFRFTSKILPPYLRRAKSVGQLVPWLYLNGISSSDFPEALSALGHDGSGLSATKTRWRAPSRRCGCGRPRPRTAAAARRASRWC